MLILLSMPPLDKKKHDEACHVQMVQPTKEGWINDLLTLKYEMHWCLVMVFYARSLLTVKLTKILEMPSKSQLDVIMHSIQHKKEKAIP